MSTIEWQRVDEVFQAARALSGEARTSYLEEACAGDVGLRREVALLLESYARADKFLEAPIAGAGAEPPGATDDTRSTGGVGPGATLGDFRIEAKIGSGGMGVVYAARQLSLNRRVALKVLPMALGLTRSATVRFRHEAQATAKLHHQNIVSIYAEGEEQGTCYYVMELIEGQGLDQVIASMRDASGRKAGASAGADNETVTLAAGSVTPPPKTAGSALSHTGTMGSGSHRDHFETIARWVAEAAEGLSYAHQHAVIHRDIKPSNLMIDTGGQLKIMDFGLARMLEEPGMTISGEFLGTPRYMSPEQITAGRVKIDHRTDIYSLGATLYELLTRRPPFVGKHRDEVVAAIMAKDPEPPRQVSRRVPVDLETVCLRAIEKDPDRRYQSAAEFAADLRAYIAHEPIAARRAGAVRQARKFARRHPVSVSGALGGLLAACVAIALVWAYWPEPSALSVTATQPAILRLTPPRALTYEEGAEEWSAWSPDGTRIAYAADVDGYRNVFIRTLGEAGTIERVTNEKRDTLQPAWAPDGKTIYFVRAREDGGKITPSDVYFGFIPGGPSGGDIWKRNLDTGQEKLVVPDGFRPAVAPSGAYLTFHRPLDGTYRIWRSDLDGNAREQITTDTAATAWHVEPSFSPDGSMIVYRRFTRGSANDIWVVDVASRARHALTDDRWPERHPVWSPSGEHIYYSAYRGSGINIWRIPVGPDGKPTGDPEAITVGAGHDVQPAFSPDGRLSYSTLRINSDVWRMPIDPTTGKPTGEPESLIATAREDSRAAWAPDASAIVFNSDREGDMNLYIYTFADKSTRRLTTGAGGDFQAHWQPPDGELIAFFSLRSGNADIWVVPVAGGEPRQLTTHAAQDANPFFSPDADWIAFQSDRTGRNEIWLIKPDGSGLRQLSDIGTGGHFNPWLHDGVVFTTRINGDVVFAHAVPGRSVEHLPVPADNIGGHTSFSPSGQTLMELMSHKSIWVYPLSGEPGYKILEFEDPRIILDYPVWSPDGNWCVFDRAVPQGGNVWMVEGLD